ncbi:TylF/MycF/NovP-related O-methyltransferase [Lignipirellula cremea]|uniref:Demethyldecarbamoylnovobiocin O-methyltransferase n=1 Tax=Lignipirellula cremea TaxID=2528010 RepID=A0A518E4N7_9BACT|nr:TylF/MycF/NovP-related O-methyltransferase [Lignipirellula cremea]QDU99044.1 Demethyldecarbamoylnovobiocin O-methyltransferase [Lignipirellula cremea]
MSETQIANPYEKKSLTRQVAKTILYGLQKVLPQKAYDAIYFPAFRVYHNGQIRAYEKKVARLRKSGDAAALLRAERVLSVMPHSLIGETGLEHTHDLALDLTNRQIPGSFVECGVARGGCAALIGKVAKADPLPRHCWFFDSYEGLPVPDENDFVDGRTGDHIRPLPPGSCLGTYEQVSALLFNEMNLSRDEVSLVKGWFQDTLPVTSAQVGTIALLRVDGDWYDSTMCVLENLYEQVSPGGHIIIDDYYSCYGARKATDEFRQKHGIETALASDGRGGCSFMKPEGRSAKQVRESAA